MSIDEHARERFLSDPARFIGESIKDFTHSNPMTRLQAIDNTLLNKN